jgi:hypothetical protein
MNFNKHPELEGKHAFLSPSKVGWLNYDDEKLITSYINSYSQSIGTLLHIYAQEHINYGIKINKATKNEVLLYLMKNGIPSCAIDIEFIFPNLMNYVNDAIGYRMTTEQPLVYSKFCFGTADTICFKNNFLRIHDLKTGASPVHMEQLIKYEALFCLEYVIKPSDIDSELRIYQGGNIEVYKPTPNEVMKVCDIIVHESNILTNITG